MAENKLENSLKIAIGQSVNKCFEAVDITPENIMIEIPKDSTHGDYSTNIAMQLTRTLHKNPREIATAIVDSLDQEAAHVEKVEIAGPGFIALAAMIFGRWNPVGAMLSSLFFGLSQSLAIIGKQLPVISHVPNVYLQIAPYILTIIVLAAFFGQSVAPKADGVNYIKSK